MEGLQGEGDRREFASRGSPVALLRNQQEGGGEGKRDSHSTKGDNFEGEKASESVIPS